MKIRILFVIVLIGLVQLMYAQKKITPNLNVTLYWDKATVRDTLYFFINNPVHPGRNIIKMESTLKDGKYSFSIPVTDSTGYFTIKIKANLNSDSSKFMGDALIVKKQFWRLGDKINIYISHHKETGLGAYNNCTFKGKNALRYKVFRETDSILLNAPDIIEDSESYFQNPQERILLNALNNLEKYRSALSSQDYCLIAASIKYYNGQLVFNQFYERYLKLKDEKMKDDFIKQYAIYDRKLNYRFCDEGDLINTNLINFLLWKYNFESKLKNDGKINSVDMFDEITLKEHGSIRDRLIAKLLRSGQRPSEFDLLQKKASKFVREKYSEEIINQFATQAKGKKLEDFTFLDIYDNKVKLSDFKGKIVVVDIWANGCGGCHLIYRNVISKLKNKYPASDVVFVSIGVDKRKERWLEGIKSGLYTSKDEFNLYTGDLGYEHPLFKENVTSGTPTVFILNKAGAIVKFNSKDLYTEIGMSSSIKVLL